MCLVLIISCWGKLEGPLPIAWNEGRRRTQFLGEPCLADKLSILLLQTGGEAAELRWRLVALITWLVSLAGSSDSPYRI